MMNVMVMLQVNLTTNLTYMTQSSLYNFVYHEDRSEISLHMKVPMIASPYIKWYGQNIAKCNDSVRSSLEMLQFLHSLKYLIL